MTTQISSPCITDTDICNGSYGCGTDTEMAVLARVVPVWAEQDWSVNTTYGPLTVVKAPGSDTLYISKVPVPAGVELGDKKYWALYNDNKTASEAKEIAEAARQEVAGAVAAADAATEAVANEAKARQDADSSIEAMVTNEQTAREAADTAINAELERVSGNADALSKRVDDLEQNGGGGLETINQRLDNLDGITDGLGKSVVKLGEDDTELKAKMANVVIDGEGNLEGEYRPGPFIEEVQQQLTKLEGEVVRSSDLPLEEEYGGTGAGTFEGAAKNIITRHYSTAAMGGQDAWTHGTFTTATPDSSPVTSIEDASNYLPLPGGGTKGVIAQFAGNPSADGQAVKGNPILQMASTANGMLYSRFLSNGLATTSPDSWVQHPSKAEVESMIEAAGGSGGGVSWSDVWESKVATYQIGINASNGRPFTFNFPPTPLLFLKFYMTIPSNRAVYGEKEGFDYDTASSTSYALIGIANAICIPIDSAKSSVSTYTGIQTFTTNQTYLAGSRLELPFTIQVTNNETSFSVQLNFPNMGRAYQYNTEYKEGIFVIKPGYSLDITMSVKVAN